MKICLITARRDPTVRPLDYDGGGNHVFNYACQLSALGHEVHIITQLEHKTKTDNPEKRKLQEKLGEDYYLDLVNNIHFHRLSYKYFKAQEHIDNKYIMESDSFCTNLKEFYKKFNFDVYHYFHLFSVSGFYKNNGNIPFSEKTIFSPLLPSLGRTYENCLEKRVELEKRVFKDVAYITYNSICEKDIIIKKYLINENKLFSSLPGIDLKLFNSKNTRVINKDCFTIIYPNAIRPQKRQLFLTKALLDLREQNPQIKFKFLIIGRIVDEKYFNKILKYISKYNSNFSVLEKNTNLKIVIECESDFVFVNGVEHEILSKLIKSSNLAVFPSLDETFGISVIETMACGIPIICYSLKAYNSFVIKNHNAITLNRKAGIQELNLKIAEAITKDKKHIRKLTTNGVKKASEFGWENVITNLHQVYTEINALNI